VGSSHQSVRLPVYASRWVSVTSRGSCFQADRWRDIRRLMVDWQSAAKSFDHLSGLRLALGGIQESQAASRLTVSCSAARDAVVSLST